MSEKRLVRASGQALRSPNTELTGPRRAVHYPALHSRTDFFFSGRSWDYINIRSPHNAHFLSTYRSVRLHNSFTCTGNRTDYFCLGWSPNGTARVIATIGITHGRKTVSPSRNPCDSDPFLVATHNRCSPSWNPHRYIFFRAGARTEPHQLGPTAERRPTADLSNQIFLYARSRMKRHLRC